MSDEDYEEALPVVDPATASAMAEKVRAASLTDFPDAPEPESDLVDLPGGLVVDGRVIRTAQVRELTGAHEEKIFRALSSRNVTHLLNTVLECGTVRLGSEPEKSTPELLKKLVVGDREAILLGIRCMTYDDVVEISGWPCPACEEPTDIKMNLREDVEVKKSGDPAAAMVFDVPLRHGGKASVRLPNGADQEALGEDPKRNVKERETVLLQRCIESIEKPDGTKIMLSAFPSYARAMGIKDRRAVLAAIAERAPGPQYTDIKLTHASCGKEVSLALDLADLFLQ